MENEAYMSMSPAGASRGRRKGVIIGISVLIIALLTAAVVFGVWVYKLKNDSSDDSSPNVNPYADIAKMIDETRDTSVNPCVDFYQYACGGWLKKNPLRPDQTRLSRSFTVIGDRNLDVLHKTAEQNWPVIGAFYKSCMDTATIDNLGAQPLQPFLDKLQTINTRSDLFGVAGELLSQLGASSFFSIYVAVDPGNPAKNIINLGQGGLTMPGYRYYQNADTVAKYTTHITNMFKLLGDDEATAQANAQAIVDFESKIAAFTLPPEALRDPYAVYNKYTYETLAADFNLPWDAFFNSSSIAVETLDANVEVPEFMSKLADLVQATSTDDLTQYLRWKSLNAAASSLSTDFATESFNFFGKTLSGQEAPEARWKTCTRHVDSNLGDIINRYFVQTAFPGESKTIAKQMIEEVKESFGKNLPNLDWMDDETRAAAYTKLDQIVDLIGFPDKWTDYSSVSIGSKTYFENLVNVQTFQWAQALERLHGPVDKTRWQMTASTVNAYYDPSYNTINFPAGIIQPTFFSADYPAAMNFGGIGMVMGHEVSHGFDDQGSQYDGTGKLTQWWTEASVERFKEKTKCYVNQYSNMQYEWGGRVNGNLTLGENIADNAGLEMAYRAFKAHEAAHGANPPLPTEPPLSNDQLYFLAFAQGWCTQINQQTAEFYLDNDPHAPAFARVNGPVQNFPKFAEAYGCKAGDPMAPVDRCSLW